MGTRTLPAASVVKRSWRSSGGTGSQGAPGSVVRVVRGASSLPIALVPSTPRSRWQRFLDYLFRARVRSLGVDRLLERAMPRARRIPVYERPGRERVRSQGRTPGLTGVLGRLGRFTHLARE